MYGFVGYAEDEMVAFFHLGSFQSPFKQEPFPPPIVGERVDVEMYPMSEDSPHKVPKAKRVIRAHPVEVVQGTVTLYDHSRGFGFIRGDDGKDYYLHGSEMVYGRLPLPEHRVKFYSGERKGRPRACFVEIISK